MLPKKKIDHFHIELKANLSLETFSSQRSQQVLEYSRPFNTDTVAADDFPFKKKYIRKECGRILCRVYPHETAITYD